MKTKIALRKEQEENVVKTMEIFDTYDTMLWDCKMRYGKTVTAYELIRRMNEKGLFKKVIVVTHRPAVQDGWGDDHELIFAGSNHKFIDKTNGKIEYDGALDAENDRKLNHVVASGIPFVYFASIQDLRGSARVGGKFNKNNQVFDINWDLIIIDEAHEGTQTELGDAVITNLKKANTKLLSLSGTPYNIMGEFQENKYTWTYVDEQKAKKQWEEDHPGEKNPYEELPTMNIFTFDLTEQIPESYRYCTEDSAFNFREFFRTWTGDKDKDYRDVPFGMSIGDFVHDKDVYNFLSLISKDDSDSNYPFSTQEYRDMFGHTFWMVPGVAAAKALSAMLGKHPRFKDEYHVVNIAGEGDEEQPYDEALALVKSSIKTYDKTITISCGKLNTGVTVREWTGVMMLSGSSSTVASGYMQTIFRVQSPGCINGKQKTNCYVFDFAPDRTLKVIAEVHSLRHKRGAGEDEKAKQILGEFLNFCPIIAVDGTVMRTYDVPEMMRQIKKISIEAAINSGFDDDTVYKSDAGLVVDKFDAEILKKLSDVVVPQKKGKKQTTVDINVTGMTDEERKKAEAAEKKKRDKKPLTEEEKEALEKLKKQREEQRKMFDLLRAVSIRLPLLFYGADADITEIIHLKDFVNLVDDESWEEFMPRGLKKSLFLDILKYYDEDIVTAAGLRIRKLAKAADELPPTLRAKRIVEILSRFKNPDKETVLTPWRVVNMHLGDTIGGFNFFDEKYEKEIEVPRMIEQGNVTADILLNTDAKILELNSKSGLYPLYMTYSIYMMYVDGDERTFPLEKAQEIWFNTLEKNIFVLCKTKMARTITIRTLAGYSGKKVNAIYLTKLIDERMKDIPRLSNKLKNPKTWEKDGDDKMKFDAVVGNPPYQGENHQQIYPYFYKLAINTGKYVSLIFPIGWQQPKNANNLKMMNNPEIKEDSQIVKIHNVHNVFPGISGAEWVNIVLWQKDYANGFNGNQCVITDDVKEIKHIPYDESDIVKPLEIMTLKDIVLAREDFTSVQTITSMSKPYGIRKDVFSKYEKYKLPSFQDKKSCDNDIIVYGSFATKKYTPVDYPFPRKTTAFDKYKVLVGSAWGNMSETAGLGGAYANIIIAGPQEACTETYQESGCFDTYEQAAFHAKYLLTKFARACLYINKISQMSTQAWSAVPVQTYCEDWWNLRISEIDEKLFEKYALPDHVKDFIRKRIQTKDESNIINFTGEIPKNNITMSYQEFVEFLITKYGKATHNYFKDTGCSVKNPAVSRTSEGLYCHHIDEDKAIMLCNDKFAAQNPFEYQRKDRLVYCNLLEHLILHTKIAEHPSENANKGELPGIGGAINFICKELNDIYAGKEFADEWRQKVADVVRNDFDDYVTVLRYLWNVIENNPLYKEVISKEMLCVGYDDKIVDVVWNALNDSD